MNFIPTKQFLFVFNKKQKLRLYVLIIEMGRIL